MSQRFSNGSLLASGLILTLVCVGSAVACPVCDSPTAHEVRAGLAADGMVKTIAAIVAPFVVLVSGLRVYNVGFVNFFRLHSLKQ